MAPKRKTVASQGTPAKPLLSIDERDVDDYSIPASSFTGRVAESYQPPPPFQGAEEAGLMNHRHKERGGPAANTGTHRGQLLAEFAKTSDKLIEARLRLSAARHQLENKDLTSEEQQAMIRRIEEARSRTIKILQDRDELVQGDHRDLTAVVGHEDKLFLKLCEATLASPPRMVEDKDMARIQRKVLVAMREQDNINQMNQAARRMRWAKAPGAAAAQHG